MIQKFKVSAITSPAADKFSRAVLSAQDISRETASLDIALSRDKRESFLVRGTSQGMKNSSQQENLSES